MIFCAAAFGDERYLAHTYNLYYYNFWRVAWWTAAGDTGRRSFFRDFYGFCMGAVGIG